MSAVPSRGNRSTEQRMITLFRAAQITGYRKHWKVVGRPDFAWPQLRVAVFLDGCFWHGCPYCTHKPSKSNVRFWRNKIQANRRRDRRVARKLRGQGWSVLRIWECKISKAATLLRIRRALANRSVKKRIRGRNVTAPCDARHLSRRTRVINRA